jgi:hypothetical protein
MAGILLGGWEWVGPNLGLSPQSARTCGSRVNTSLDYMTARHAFEVAVDEARREGWPDEEIAHITGMSR